MHSRWPKKISPEFVVLDVIPLVPCQYRESEERRSRQAVESLIPEQAKDWCTRRTVASWEYPSECPRIPFSFRGVLDVRATAINEERELAATRALADLAKEGVADSVCRAYGVTQLKFGREYLIPKPFDPRVLMWEVSSVAEAVIQMITCKGEVFFLPTPASTANRRPKIWTRSRSARHTCPSLRYHTASGDVRSSRFSTLPRSRLSTRRKMKPVRIRARIFRSNRN